MTQLSRDALLGWSKEVSTGIWLAPTNAIAFTKADFEDITTPIEDKSYRGNDTDIQGLYPGVQEVTWDIEVLGYPDLIGMFLRSIIGPDTITPGVTTTLSASTAAAATSITTALTIPTGSLVSIGTGATLEWFTSGVPTGPGPFTIPVSNTSNPNGLLYAHTASGPTTQVSTATVHTFKQSPSTAQPTYSLTVWDTVSWLGYSSGKCTDLALKIDPKAGVSVDAKLLTLPFSNQSTQSETFNQIQPFLGWQWTQTNAGGVSSRGQTLDLTLKRAGTSIHASNGSQAAREVFTAVINADGSYKAIYENTTDLALFQNYSQLPVTASLAKPVSFGGESLALTMTKSGFKTAKRDLSTDFAEMTFDISGIYNSTDGGAVSAVLTNWVTTAY